VKVFILAILLYSNVTLASVIEEMVKEGIRLHDAGEYEDAISRYKEALKLEPESAMVLYEMALSYQASGDNKECIRTSDEGFKYRSEYRSQLYVAKGSCQSQTGDYESAIKTFGDGLKEFPNDAMLHFNIGITLYNSNRIKDASEHFKKCIENKPAYPSPYYMLAQSFHERGYRIPAVYLYSQFVLLEPNTQRSIDASKKLLSLIMSSVSRSDDGDVNIYVNPDGPVDEGDFSEQDMMLSIGASMMIDNEVKKIDKVMPLTMNLNALAEMSKNDKSRRLESTFIWRYAIQNMIALHERDNIGPLSYILAVNAGIEGADGWLEENSEKLDSLFMQRKELPSFSM